MFRRNLLCSTAAMCLAPADVTSIEAGAKRKTRKTETSTDSSSRKTGWWEYQATIIGTSPMIQNPATDEVLDQLQYGTRAKKSADKSTPSPQIAFKRLCRGPNGEYGMPADYLRACLNTAGREVIYEKKTKMATAETSKIPAFLRIETGLIDNNGDHFIAFHDQTGSEVTADDLGTHQTLEQYLQAGGKPVAWVVDRRKGNLKQGAGKGVAVALIRPKFKAWSFDVRLQVNHDLVEISKIRELLVNAGIFSGLGDFRPTCKGPFGCFKLKELAEIGQVPMEEDEAA